MRLQVSVENQFLDIRTKSSVFQLDVEQAVTAERIENIGQKRDRFAESGIKASQLVVGQVRHAASTVSSAVDRLIVDHDDTAVTAPADVKFHTGRAALESLFKRPNCVFGPPWISWRSAVSKDNHTFSVLRTLLLI